MGCSSSKAAIQTASGRPSRQHARGKVENRPSATNVRTVKEATGPFHKTHKDQTPPVAASAVVSTLPRLPSALKASTDAIGSDHHTAGLRRRVRFSTVKGKLARAPGELDPRHSAVNNRNSVTATMDVASLPQSALPVTVTDTQRPMPLGCGDDFAISLSSTSSEDEGDEVFTFVGTRSILKPSSVAWPRSDPLADSAADDTNNNSASTNSVRTPLLDMRAPKPLFRPAACDVNTHEIRLATKKHQRSGSTTRAHKALEGSPLHASLVVDEMSVSDASISL